MLTFIIIVAIILLLAKAYKPKEKVSDYYSHHPELKKVVRYQSHEMNGLKSVLNLGLDQVDGLDILSYNNFQIILKLKNGKSLSGNIRDLTVTFVLGKKGYLDCTVKSSNQKIRFANYYGLFSDQEYLDIYELLSNCGTIRGVTDYKAYKAKFEYKAKAKEKVKEFVSPLYSGGSTNINQNSSQQSLHETTSVFCPLCGRENKKGARFCQYCGKELN